MMAKDPLEPDAATSGTSGSEGAGSWQHDPATRLTGNHRVLIGRHEIGIHPFPGKGPLVVAAHGAESGWREWERLACRLAHRYRLVALDLPWRAGNDYSWAREASAGEWLRRAMELIDEPVAAAAGHSLGANALMEYLCLAGRHDVGAAMLFAPFYRPADEPVDEALEKEFALAFRYAIADGIRIAMSSRYDTIDRSIFGAIVDTALGRIGPFGISMLYRHFVGTGTLPVSDIHARTSVLVGADDPALVKRRGAALARAMPAAAVAHRAGYGHCFHVSRADQVAAEVLEFLAGAGEAPRAERAAKE